MWVKQHLTEESHFIKKKCKATKANFKKHFLSFYSKMKEYLPGTKIVLHSGSCYVILPKFKFKLQIA